MKKLKKFDNIFFAYKLIPVQARNAETLSISKMIPMLFQPILPVLLKSVGCRDHFAGIYQFFGWSCWLAD